MPEVVRYRIGDGILEVASDHAPLLEALDARYGGCAVEPDGQATTVRCDATTVAGGSSLHLKFATAPTRDAVSVALGMVAPVRGWARLAEGPPIDGWRRLVDTENARRQVVASRGDTVVIDVDEAPSDFAVDYLICVVQSAQRGLVFLHGASVALGETGILLLGASKAGKSTLALALALRGHGFLGDDMAAVRLQGRQLLPFRRAVGVREGPVSSDLLTNFAGCRHVVDVAPNGEVRRFVRVDDVLPLPSRPVTLGAAFVLDGFSDHPEIRPYPLGLADLDRLRAAALFWDPSPGRQIMKFTAIVHLLAAVPCFLLNVGAPDASAQAIEKVVETT